jgi:Periplasmic binding protein domain
MEHFFGTALAIEELNNAGGVSGMPIEPVVFDPTSDPLTYRRYAERLLGDEGVNVIFGCSTSSCRKAVLAALVSVSIRRLRILSQRDLHRRRAKPEQLSALRIPD